MTTDLEQRVDALERDVASLKERVDILDADMKNIPDLIKTEIRLVESRCHARCMNFAPASTSNSPTSINALTP
jgi:hypothetical protein